MLANLGRSIKNVLYLLAAIALCVLCVALCVNSKKIGAGVGSVSGKAVGMAVGSFDGVTEGISAGYHEGKEEGLSAKDIEGEVENKVTELGNLRVLVANVEITDNLDVGTKASSLDVFCGNAVFSVDLTKAEITRNAKGAVVITLPEPTADLNIDISRTKRLAEYQRLIFNGSAGDGIDAYLNTLKTINDFAWEKVSNYDTLMTMAKDSAVKQVKRVTEGVCVDCSGVDVKFRGEN